MDSQPTPTFKLVMTDSPSVAHDIPDVELGFRFDELSALNPRIEAGPGRVADHLAHAVAAHPYNLLRHTQRVFFFYENFDSEGLYSALLDLFIALGDKGPVLRRRLLMGGRDRMLPEQFAALARWLAQGAPAEEKDLPFSAQSILSRGIVGVRHLVHVVNIDIDPNRDPLLDAREHIEYFQIEEARDLLEAAIFEQPGREELHIELAHLYLATRDRARFQAMREKLSQIMPTLPDCWFAPDEPEPPQGGANP
ncbi:MAG: FimV family protein [Candidatus Methylumidiphilus sp.]